MKQHTCNHSVSSSLRLSVSAPLQLHTIPPEDPTVYDMICKADTIGVFQIESRAQMQMLPRLRPRCFYDLVIEVAIVRPGPIQGDMVHPYLRRRNGQDPVTYPDDKVKAVLAKTLGVPLFQEQAMTLAIVAAGFTPGEADQLRRAMAAWKRPGNLIEKFQCKFIGGMLARGYTKQFATQCFNQLKGFSEYGFPESHAASFALIVYVSAWLKKHHPAEFAAALLNSQPMGFYAPAQIVRDAQDHGVEVRPVDVNCSDWDCTLEEKETEWLSEKAHHDSTSSPCLSVSSSLSPALRLGTRLVKGLREDHARQIVQAVHEHGPFDSIEHLWRASGVPIIAMRKLASADAFNSMGLDRQHALWQVRALHDEKLEMFERRDEETQRRRGKMREMTPSLSLSVSPSLPLPPIPPLMRVMHDYASLNLSLKAHPVSFIRDLLDKKRVTPARELENEALWKHGRRIAVAGIALVRQRPATASGVVFITIEDETGVANLIVRPRIFEKYRRAARHGIVLLARGTIEREGDVVHIMTHSLEMLDSQLRQLTKRSRDFH